MHGSMRDKIRLVFNSFDSDGNGVLSKEEFMAAADRFSTAKNRNQLAEKYFRECDKSKNGKVSFNEFHDWVNENPKKYEALIGILNVINVNEDPE